MKKYILPETNPTHPYETERTHLRTLGRVHAEEAAKILGFQSFDIPVLVHHKLLKPLGNPVQNSVKYFAAVQILSAARDPEWLDKATKVISRYWHEKNERKKTKELARNSSNDSSQPS
jgi:hypothetical protein